MLRSQVRAILADNAPRRLSRDLLANLAQAEGIQFEDAELTRALDWNLERGNLAFSHNHELEVDVYYLTERGAASV